MKILLIIATILVILGLAISITVLSTNGWNFNIMNTARVETTEHNITDSFSNIFIKNNTAKIVFLPSDTEETKVVCTENTNFAHSVTVESDTLKIIGTKSKKWYHYVSLFQFTRQTVTVYMPAAEYSSLFIETNTGDISLPADFAFGNLSVETDTGKVSIMSEVNGNLNVETDTGDILFDSASNVKEANFEVTTGNLKIFKLRCENLSIESDTGDVKLTDVISSGNIFIESDTGNVKFDSCDGKNINVETDTGDVKGSFLTAKHFIPKTATGKYNVPETISDEKCKVTTSTGNINLTVKE